MPWQEIIKFLGGASIFGAVIAYLGKKSIESYLSGRLESYKHDLQLSSVEHSVRFQSLHAERATIIKEFYEKLTHMNRALGLVLKAFHSVQEASIEKKVREVAEKYDDLYDYFQPRRIFFEASLCAKIDSILDASRDIFFDITTHPVDPRDHQYEINRALLKERHEFWEKARGVHRDEILKIKQELESEFRKVIGINA